jgi:3-oxoacyl-[acyl-carrier protein] reductase
MSDTDKRPGAWLGEVNLEGQVALVTGGSRGIGRVISQALSAAGAHVVIAARTENQVKKTAEEITLAGGRASARAVDLSREQDVITLFADLRQNLGRLGILINNAGIGSFGPLKDFPVAEFDRLMATNLRAAFLCCQQALQIMVPQRQGYIINISSVVGFKGYLNQAAYTATKHGLMGLTKTLAGEAQEYGIRVSAISPGGVDTGMAGDARPDLDRSILLQPEDIARTVLFLLSLPERAAIDHIYIRRRTSQPF